MIDKLIEYALKHRLLTILLVLLVSIWGVIVYTQMSKDIYPDLNAPLVNIITENPGMAAEDVERLITFPLESLLNGAPHVTRVRSESATGDSVVTVEFDWGMDIYLARQIVSSKLELISGRLPIGTTQPILGPVSSRMGEIFEFAVIGEETDPMELRSIADWTIRYRLQGVEGVSFVINLGGFIKQFQVYLKPEMLKNYDVTINEVKEAIENSNRNFSGGIIMKGSQETLIKGVGRLETIDHIQNTVITSRNNVPVYVKDVADVKIGPKFRRESGSHNGKESVYVTIEKQYGGDTLTAIANVKQTLARIAEDLPERINIKAFYDQSILIVKSIEHVDLNDPLFHTDRADPDGSVRDQADCHVHRRISDRHWKSGQRLDPHGREHLPGASRKKGPSVHSGTHLGGCKRCREASFFREPDHNSCLYSPPHTSGH
jgi:Cu/Ag efflux pump CusA